MPKVNFHRAGGKRTIEPDPETAARGRSRAAFWTGILLAALTLAYIAYACIHVFIVEQGRAGLPDQVLRPTAVILLLAAGVALRWIRRGRYLAGIRLLYLAFALVPPITAVLVVKGLILLAMVFIVLLTVVFIAMLLPSAAERNLTLAGLLSILVCLVIEWWNPAFRLALPSDILIWIAAGLAGLVLLALSIRQAVVGDILTKMIVSFVSIT